MAIKFKVIERGRPGVPGGGEKKFYASAVMAGELSLAELTKAIEKIWQARSIVSGLFTNTLKSELTSDITFSTACQSNLNFLFNVFDSSVKTWVLIKASEPLAISKAFCCLTGSSSV
jgi:hypothetical protein